MVELLLAVILPGGDTDLVGAFGKECFHESGSEAGVGEQRNVMVNSATAYAVSVGEFALGVVLGNVDDKVNLMICNKVKHIIGAILIGPTNGNSFHSVFIKETCCAFGGIDFEAGIIEHAASFEHVYLATDVAGAYEHGFFRS